MGQLTPKELKKRKKAHADAIEELGTKIITASKVKAYFKTHDMRMDGDLPTAIAREVYKMLYQAVKRTQGRNSKTIRPLDL